VIKLSTIQPISTNWTITSHLKQLNTKKAATNDLGNPGHGQFMVTTMERFEKFH